MPFTVALQPPLSYLALPSLSLLLPPLCILSYVSYVLPSVTLVCCRKATVKASTNLIVLSLDRQTFVNILGPLQDIMSKEKSAEVRGI